MMLAMMLPSALALLARVGRLGASRAVSISLQTVTAAGYLAVWAVVGLAFRIADSAIHGAIDQFGDRVAHSGVVEAVRIGVSFGLSCAGCCWALMLVLLRSG